MASRDRCFPPMVVLNVYFRNISHSLQGREPPPLGISEHRMAFVRQCRNSGMQKVANEVFPLDVARIARGLTHQVTAGCRKGDPTDFFQFLYFLFEP